jgi:hypothetical protein
VHHLVDWHQATVPAGRRASTTTYVIAFPAASWRKIQSRHVVEQQREVPGGQRMSEAGGGDLVAVAASHAAGQRAPQSSSDWPAPDPDQSPDLGQTGEHVGAV